MKVKNCFTCKYGDVSGVKEPCNICLRKDTPSYCEWVEDQKESTEGSNENV